MLFIVYLETVGLGRGFQLQQELEAHAEGPQEDLRRRDNQSQWVGRSDWVLEGEIVEAHRNP